MLWSQSEDSFPWKGLVFLDSPIPSAQDLGCDVGQLVPLIIQWTFIEHHLHAMSWALRIQGQTKQTQVPDLLELTAS